MKPDSFENGYADSPGGTDTVSLLSWIGTIFTFIMMLIAIFLGVKAPSGVAKGTLTEA